MTSFLDVIRPLTTQLTNLSNKTKPAVAKYNTDTTQFQNYVINNIGGATGTVSFLGKGADACTAAVKLNATRAQQVVTKLSDFQLACDQTNTSLTDMSEPFDKESLYYLGDHDLYGLLDVTTGDQYETTVAEYFRLSQGYSLYDSTNLNSIIIWRIREDTLPGLGGQLDDLLTPGKGQGILEDNITYAVSCIQGDFQTYRTQRHNFLGDALQNKDIVKDAYTDYMSTADGMFELAMHYVNVIAQKMKVGYAEWATEFQALVGQFQIDVSTAAAINDPSIGDLISQITTGPNADAKVLIWPTSNGLIIVIKDGTTAADVNRDIQAYLKEHNLPGNTAVTLLGYQGGSSTAQDVIKGEAGQGYHVTNLVVVGGSLDDDLPANVNTYVYQAPTKETTESESTFLGLKPDQIALPIAAVVVGLLTDGAGDVALLPALGEAAQDVGTEYILAEGWNAASSWNAAHPNEPMPQRPALPIYIDTGDGHIHPITALEETQLANNQLPNAKVYFKQTSVVPNEAGTNMGNFTNSSYLNSQLIPDPGSDKLPHGGLLPAGN